MLLLAVLVAGCGSAADVRPARSDEAVVRGWAAEISRGDVEAATRRFAIPAVVSDVSGHTPLVTRAAVRFFNQTLPCGAQILRTRRLPGLLVADFRLTRRPGADCGAGAGRTASTVFAIRDGLITRWLQVPERLVP